MPTTDLTEALATARIDIARLEVQVTHLSTSVDGLKASNAQLTLKVDQVLAALSEARGGWRTLMMVGGAASTLGAGLSWAIQHIPRG